MTVMNREWWNTSSQETESAIEHFGRAFTRDGGGEQALERDMVKLLNASVTEVIPKPVTPKAELTASIKRLAHAWVPRIAYEFWRCRWKYQGGLAVDATVERLTSWMDDEIVNRCSHCTDWGVLRDAFVSVAMNMVNAVAKQLMEEGSVWCAYASDWRYSDTGGYNLAGSCNVDECWHLGVQLGSSDDDPVRRKGWTAWTCHCEWHRQRPRGSTER